MKTQSVYIDTSVFGGCFDPEFELWSRGLMDDFRDGLFIPVVSVVVAAEIEPAPPSVRAVFADIVRLDAVMLDLTDDVRDLSDAYAARQILPPKFSNDALHIALATAARIDILVSWNFKHIVRFDKIRLFNAVNIELGYSPIQIYSPREVTSYGKDP